MWHTHFLTVRSTKWSQTTTHVRESSTTVSKLPYDTKLLRTFSTIMDRHLSEIQHLLSQYGDILAEIDAGKILKTYRLVTQKETVLRNLYEDTSRNQDCFTHEDVLLLKENANNIETARVDFKKGITDLLEGCRYGQCSVMQIEQLCMDTASLIFNNYPAGIYHAITEKLALCNNLKLQNVLYLGRPFPAALRNLSLANECSEMYVLYYYKSLEAADPKIPTKLFERFLALVDQATSVPDGPKFMFIDCDLAGQVGPEEGMTNKIVYYKDGEPEFDDSEDGDSEPVPLAKSAIKPKTGTPAKKRGRVILPCPAQTQPGRCRQGSHSWNCFECEQPLEYGFDVHFYCQCGQSPVESYTFCCGLKGHRKEYVPFSPKFLDKLLDKIEPFKEINILLLGETGVGKSTWINGIANYTTYASLDDAVIEPVNLIPACFTMMDDQPKLHNVTVGNSESEASNQSGTQVPQTYVFKKDDSIVRFIDTPGIGNPQGVDYDKKNIQSLMNYLANYECLHGICILLKSNHLELPITLQYCIKEFMTYFHRDARENIVFVFTNTRCTAYRPGEAYPVLEKLFKTVEGAKISLERDTVYCVDNEAIRLMAAQKSGRTFSENERTKIRTSWETSAAETERLLQYISRRTPYMFRQTFFLNEVKRHIPLFIEPLYHITLDISANIEATKDKALEIQETQNSKQDLQERLFVTIVELESVALPQRRTVCVASKCITMVGQKVKYATWCHESCNCNTTSAVPGNYPDPNIRNCAAMDSTRLKCKHCGCSWDTHMFVHNEMREIRGKLVDRHTQGLLAKAEEFTKAEKRALQNLENRKDQLEQEKDAITKVCSRIGWFVKTNAMMLYNDAMEEYLHHLIRAEKINLELERLETDPKVLDHKAMLQNYRKEKTTLDGLALYDIQPDLSIPLDIEAEKLSLYKLPLKGELIRDLLDDKHVTKVWQMPPSETVYNPRKPRRKPQQNSSQRGLRHFLEDYIAAAKRNPPIPVDPPSNRQEITDLANTVNDLRMDVRFPYRNHSSYSDSFSSVGVPQSHYNIQSMPGFPSPSRVYPRVDHVRGHSAEGPPVFTTVAEQNYQHRRMMSAYDIHQSKPRSHNENEMSLPSYNPPYDPHLMQQMPAPYKDSVPQSGQGFYNGAQTNSSTYRPYVVAENPKLNTASPSIHGLGEHVPHLPLSSGNWIHPQETFTPQQHIYHTPSAPPLDERSNVPMQTPNTRYESQLPAYGMYGGMDYSERNMPSHGRDWREGDQASSVRGGTTYEHESSTTAPESDRAVNTPTLYDYDILPDASQSMQYGSQRMPHPANILQPGVFNRTALHSATALMAGGAAIMKMLQDRRGRTRGNPDRRAGQQ